MGGGSRNLGKAVTVRNKNCTFIFCLCHMTLLDLSYKSVPYRSYYILSTKLTHLRQVSQAKSVKFAHLRKLLTKKSGNGQKSAFFTSKGGGTFVPRYFELDSAKPEEIIDITA